jgi:hypothetical protein
VERETGTKITLESFKENSPLCFNGGKGAGEALMYERFVTHFLDRRPDVEHIMKVTGKLYLASPRQIPSLPTNTRYITCQLNRNLTFMDTRFYCVDVKTFRDFFLGMAPMVCESNGEYLEQVAAKAALRACLSGVPRIGAEYFPSIRGISGGSGRRYRGLRSSVGRIMRIVEHRLSLGAV